MFKKFISMATAAILFGTGLSVIATAPASASGQALNFSSSKIKGVTLSSRGSFPSPSFLTSRGTITLTSAQAASTSGSDETVMVTSGATATVKRFVGSLPADATAFSNSGTVVTSTLALSSDDIIIIGLALEGSNNISSFIGYTISVTGGSTPAPSTPTLTAAEIAAAAAAAARAAEAAAAAIRAAEIATAQTALATALRGDKPGTLSEYRAANINITTTAGLTRLNAEVLKLAGADRTDFAKIKAIADRIEFDESFFNATARPSIATYTTYGVTGVTERILPTINAKVLELPAALRVDVKAMQELVKVESFVDRVANPSTRSTVSAAALVSRGLLAAEHPRRHSVIRGLATYPEGSLNTMAKIEAAIKAEIAKAEAPKLRLAEIKAKIAARKK